MTEATDRVSALQAELARARDQQAAIGEVLAALARVTDDATPVFETILEHAARLCGADRGTIVLRDGDVSRIQAGWNVPEVAMQELARAPYPIDRGNAVGRTILEGRTLRWDDMRADKELSPRARTTRALTAARSVLAVPLLKQGTAIGAINLRRTEVRPFSDEEARLVETFAAQAVLAVDSVQRHRATRDALERQTAVSEVLGAISRSVFDLDTVLTTIVERAATLCGADRDGSLFLVTGDRVRFAAGVATDDAGFRTWREDLRRAGSVDLADTWVVRTVVRSRDVFHVVDATTDPTSAKVRGDATKFGYRAVLGVPLLRQGEVVGVLSLLRSQPRAFTAHEIAVVRTFADQAAIAIENVRLFHETERALERQTALAEVLKAIAGSPSDVEPVLAAIAENAARFCGAADASVLLIDGEALVRKAHHGPVQSTGRPLRLDRTSIAATAILEDRTIAIRDVLGPEGAPYTQARDRAEESGQRGMLATPLRREGRPLGAILLRKTDTTGFSAEQMALVEAFADQAVIAIENVRLFDQTKEALEQQTAVAGVLEAINSAAFDEQPVLQELVERAARLCQARLVSISLWDGTAYATRAWSGTDVPDEYGGLLLAERRLPERGSLIGRTVLERRTIAIDDALADTDYTQTAMQQSASYRSLLGVPLLRDGFTIGVFALERGEVRPFTPAQIKLVETFAQQAVIAIENVRLFKETKEALEQQQAISEILEVISSSPTDIQPVLDAIARNAARFCAAEDCGVALIRPDGLLEQVAQHGPISKSLPPWPVDRTSVRGRAIVDRQVIHVVDMLAEPPGEYAIGVERAKELGQRSILAAPLLREGVPLGAIALRRTEVRPFSERQIALLRTFADQAAIAIENVRLFNETKLALERQTAVADVLKTISQTTFDLQAVFDVVVENATKLCRGDFGYLFQRVGDAFQLIASIGGTPALREYELAHPTPISPSTLIGRVALERSVVHIHDVFTEPGYDWPPNRENDVHTVAAVPILSGGAVVGAIGAGRFRVEPYTAEELRLFETFADQAGIAIENARLFNETKEALEQQTAVSDVLAAISESAFDLEPILQTVIDNAVRLSGADNGSIVRDLDRRVWTQVAHAGRFVDKEAYVRAAIGRRMVPGRKSATGRVLEEKRTIQIADIQTDPDYEQFPEQHAASGARAILGVPLLREGTVIGVILLRRWTPGLFGDTQVKVVETFAAQAVIAIENVRLFSETKESLERQTATAEVLKVISGSAFDLPSVLRIVISHATRLTAAEAGFVYQVDGEVLRMSAAHGERAEVMQEWQRDNPIRVDNVGSSTGRAFAERRTVHIPDVLADPTYTYHEAQRLGQFRTLLSVPLLQDDRAIGVLALWQTTVRPFSASEIALVESFADQAVIAIQNVHLFNETRSALEQQTAISDVLKTISQNVFELSPTIQTVVQTAGRLADADVALMTQRTSEGFAGGGRYASDPQTLERMSAPGLGGPTIDEHSVMGRVYREARTVNIADLTLLPELHAASPRLRETGARSVLAVPVRSEGELVAAIVLGRLSVRPFGEREARLVETFADQAGIAIQNVRLFNEVQRKRAELEAANRHKSEFLANMSHELRTPLNAIIGFSEVLLQGIFGAVNQKQQEYLEDVLSSGKHLLSLINDILDLSKIEAGRMELETSSFSIANALDSGLTIVRERASRHGITLSATIPPDLPQLEADERKVKQILYNLLSNAVKFTPDGGRVDVRASLDDDQLRVDVQDNGIGIAPVDQARVFEEFQQVGRERSREGTGLGLTLTRRIVELHGGRIWVESAPGHGSTFSFTLPLRRSEVKA